MTFYSVDPNSANVTLVNLKTRHLESRQHQDYSLLVPQQWTSAPNTSSTWARKDGPTTARVCCTVSAVALAVSVFTLTVFVIVLFVRIDGVISDATVTMKPHMNSMLTNVGRIFNNTASATGSLARMGVSTDVVVERSAPLLAAMVNNTHSMINRANRFTSHNPSISIGTGGVAIG